MWRRDLENTIGRGETAESRIEAPLFAGFILTLCALVFAVQLTLQNQQFTIALGVSLFVFGITIARVEYGLYILVVAMLLSPEIEAGAVGTHNENSVNLRYDDILIIVIFFGVIAKQAFEGHPRLWRANPVNAGIFAYFGVCIISTILALRRNVEAWDAPVAAFVMLKMLEFYLVFFMVGTAVNSVREIRRQLTVFFVVSLIVSLYAILSIGRIDRVSAPFEAGGTEPNTLGGYLLIVICIAVSIALSAPTRRTRAAYFAVAIVAIVPFMHTLSRASYVALAVALLTLGILSRRTALVVTVGAILLASPYIMPDTVIDRVTSTFDEGGQHVVVAGKETDLRVDKSTYERIYVWEKVRFNLTVWPWFGGGVSWETVLDSQYARVLLETGLIGFAAYLFLLYRLLRTGREAYLWSGDWLVKGLAFGTVAATVGLMIHSFGTISFLIVRIMEPFWFLMALTVVGRSLAIEEHARRLETENAQVQLAA